MSFKGFVHPEARSRGSWTNLTRPFEQFEHHQDEECVYLPHWLDWTESKLYVCWQTIM